MLNIMVQPDAEQQLTPEEEQLRNLRVSELYPNPHAGKIVHDSRETTQSAPIGWLTIACIGIIIPLPYIVFDFGLSFYASVTTLTDSLQLGTLMTVFLLFVVLLMRLTYIGSLTLAKAYFPRFSLLYLLVLLVCLLASFYLRPLFPHPQQSSIYPIIGLQPLYYLAVCAISCAAVAILAAIQRRHHA